MNKAILALFCCLLASTTMMAQSVADQTFRVDGVHEFYYAFAEGDKVDLMVQLIAGRRLKTVELIGLPANTIFRSYELDTALTKNITIPQTGAYLLRITEQGFGKKICRFTLHRTPSSPATARMDTRINWDIKTQKGWQVLHRAIPAGFKTDIHSMSGQVTVSGSGMGLKKTALHIVLICQPIPSGGPIESG